MFSRVPGLNHVRRMKIEFRRISDGKEHNIFEDCIKQHSYKDIIVNIITNICTYMAPELVHRAVFSLE